MGKQTISIKTYKAFVDEIELAAKNKNRTISSISDKSVKKLVLSGYNAAIGSGVAAVVGLIGGGVSTGAISSFIGGSTGTAIGTVGGTAAGALSSGIIIGGTTATGAIASGAGAGSTVGTLGGPIGIAVGATIGAAVGITVGVFAGKTKKNRDLQRQQTANQKIMEMQNKEIRQLKEEAQKLANIASKTRTDNERLKYLISVLKINQSLKVAVEKNNGVK